MAHGTRHTHGTRVEGVVNYVAKESWWVATPLHCAESVIQYGVRSRVELEQESGYTSLSLAGSESLTLMVWYGVCSKAQRLKETY